MTECPYCAAALQSTTLAGEPVDACPSCGGAWVTSAVLTAVVKTHPEELAPFSDRWRDQGGRPPLTRVGTPCAHCGDELQTRTFPVAPALPVLACAKCQRLFFKHGQLRVLHETVSPSTLPVVAPPPVPETPVGYGPGRIPLYAAPAEEDDAPSDPWRWPERYRGQPWASWFVCGMPWWCVGVMFLVGALTAWGILAKAAGAVLASGEEAKLVSIIAGPAVFLVLPFAIALKALLVGVALSITVAISGGGLPLSFFQVWLLLIKTLAVVQAVSGLLVVVVLVAPTVTIGLLVTGLGFVLQVVLYRQVLELEWNEVFIMSAVGSCLNGTIGF